MLMIECDYIHEGYEEMYYDENAVGFHVSECFKIAEKVEPDLRYKTVTYIHCKYG